MTKEEFSNRLKSIDEQHQQGRISYFTYKEMIRQLYNEAYDEETL